MTPRLRASLVCQAEGRLLVVRLRDPSTGVVGLYPPGGGVEEGESPAEAAERETLEETGLVVRANPALTIVRTHPFRWDAIDFDVTTHYFGAALEHAPPLSPVHDAPYHEGASWLPVEDALEAMALHPVIASASRRVVRMIDHAAWRTHAHFGGPAALLLSIHDQFRVASKRLLHALASPSPPDATRVGLMFRPLATTLHHHHHAEEAMLFPAIERQGETPPARLVRDHAELTRAIEAVEMERGLDTVTHFDAVLEAHLDREERLVMPFLLGWSPAEAWALLG